jgi:hypothetical protein
MSRVPGFDATDIIFQSDEAFVEYQIRVVPDADALVTDGSLVEQASGSWNAFQSVTVTLTDDELVAAQAVEGDNMIKIFVRDAAGNWSGAAPLLLPFSLPATLAA